MIDKVVVFGSRDFKNDFQASLVINEKIQELIPAGAIVMHGNARGTDLIAAAAAERKGCDVRAFPADWDTLGKKAGPIRNKKMLDEEPFWALGFWNGSSRGSQHMIKECEKRGIKCVVVMID